MSTRNDTTEYNVSDLPFRLPVILEDDPIHLPPYYFCPDDPTCPCRSDPELLAHVASEVRQGLLTEAEASRIIYGIQIKV